MNVLPLHFGTHSTPVLPVVGAEYSGKLAATRESMIKVTLEILRRVDPMGKYVREDNKLAQGAAHAALRVQEQEQEQQADLRAAANAAAQLGSDRSSNNASEGEAEGGSATPQPFSSSASSDDEPLDLSDDCSEDAGATSTAERGAALLA